MAGAANESLPNRGGIGLKAPHFRAVLEAAKRGAGPAWAEIHPQNYAMAGGPLHNWLTAIGEFLPLSFHSVGLSLGDPDGCDREELERLACLVDRYQPGAVSDHLSWSSLSGERIPDLLPCPLTRDSLAHVVCEVSRVQDRLKRNILVENPSRMIVFAGDDYDEPEFLAELCKRSGCELLLDINNVLVSSMNLGFDPQQWLSSIDTAIVGEIHVAGHSIREPEPGLRIVVDDHGSAVSEGCWRLLAAFIDRAGPRPVLVERDNAVPAYSELAAEVSRADALLSGEIANAA